MPSSPANAPSLVRKLSDSSPGPTPTERADLAPGLRGNPGENEETLASQEPLLTPPSVARWALRLPHRPSLASAAASSDLHTGVGIADSRLLTAAPMPRPGR
ncbi:hypothetical protein P7K49_003360 [Saguinus oedipus]|uniref:Uncharacterized protein n=2 Tax=Saguinus oedipus TaxID=9490 RepID=A0ABQ9W4B9_SAGOE|nr:hypothetical protein P7K49_003360 [Saguinus oedipus]